MYDLRKKLNTVLTLQLFLLLLLSFVSCQKSKSDNIDAYIHQGNTNGNIQNNGYIIDYEEWYYYSCYRQLNRVKKSDERIKEQLTQNLCFELNAMENRIYMIEGSPGRAFSTDYDGKNKHFITDERVANLITVDNLLFYRLSTDDERWGQLYRTDLNGISHIMLAENIREFAIDDGYIYFANGLDNYSLYKMDMEGNNATKLNDENSSSINVLSGYVYYTNMTYDERNDSLCKIKSDGSEKTILSIDSCWNLNVYGEYIYYRNQTEEGKIYRMKLDGTETDQISDIINCTYINTVADKLTFYCINEQTFYISNLDGTDIKKISR